MTKLMPNPTTSLHRAHELGQSIWYDNIRRGLLHPAGWLKTDRRRACGDHVEPDHLREGDRRVGRLRGRVAGSWSRDGRSTTEIYEALAIEDIRGACDLLRPSIDEIGGVDGRVSLEVLPELAANDRADRRRRHAAGGELVGRPNVMIKVPATPEGMPAIRALTAAGVSVNVTLDLLAAQYEEVVEAYLAGLEERAAAGDGFRAAWPRSPASSSRASTRSRISCSAGRPPPGARGGRPRPGAAREARHRQRQARLRDLRGARSPRRAGASSPPPGANPQRLLWASTGTKDPRYPDTYYVDALLGRDTVDTVPPATLDAFLDHGGGEAPLGGDLEGARRAVAEFAALGLDLSRVCHGLLTDGVVAFSTSMNAITDAIGQRRAALLETSSRRQRASLPEPLRVATEDQVTRLGEARALRRIWDGDATLFSTDPVHEKSIKSRLGWLRSPALMQTKLPELTAFAAEIAGAGFSDAVLLGMGGSSLCPEVLSLTTPPGAGAVALHVLDNTDPAAVLRVDRETAGKRTLFIVVIEVRRHHRDPGLRAPLLAPGAERARRGRVAQGRRSLRRHHRSGDPPRPARRGEALPEACSSTRPTSAGDTRRSPTSAWCRRRCVGADSRRCWPRPPRSPPPPARRFPSPRCPGLALGAALGAAAKAGRDKLTLVISPAIASLGSWIEQLVAESTGKDGKGIVPVDMEPVGPPEVYGDGPLLRLPSLRRRRRGAGRGGGRAGAGGTPGRAHRGRRPSGAGARVLPLGDRDRHRGRDAWREPLRRAQRHRGQGRDRRAPGRQPGGGRRPAAAATGGHLRGLRSRPHPRPPRRRRAPAITSRFAPTSCAPPSGTTR